MNELVYAAVGVATYLVGAVPFGWLFVKLGKGQDLRTVGSGNIGATNASRVLGTGWFFPIFVLDFMKGFAPVFWVAPLIAELRPCDHCFNLPAMMACFLGLGAIMGHQFPVWLSFKGGKGAATGIGVLFALNWQAASIAMGVFFLVLAITRIVSASSILACVTVPIAHFIIPGRYTLAEQKWIVLIFLAAMCSVIIGLHKSNIRRILNGTERKLGRNDPEPAQARQ